jgi:hypothetical protein
MPRAARGWSTNHDDHRIQTSFEQQSGKSHRSVDAIRFFLFEHSVRRAHVLFLELWKIGDTGGQTNS